ncbi:MAG: hypothetical protein SGI83_06165 [Bacteroidota bacterium]|nr:hypothetical protein [Bacteroidota bacterium]
MSYRSYNKFTVALFFILLITTTGCISEKKMNRYVTSRYGKNIDLKKIKSDYITITSPLNTESTVPSQSVKKTKKVLPFIIYIRIYYQTSCTLNPRIPINQFSTAFSSYANTKKLNGKLNGGKLELSIDKVPLSFSYNDDTHILLLVHWSKIYLLPQNEEMTISYKETGSNGVETKKGVITLPDPNKIKVTRYYQSVRNATSEYLTQYEENIKAMARSAVDQLMTAL